MSKKLFAIVLFLVGSSSASALTSICSGELLPLTGLTTLKHEASWSYYDNWFYNMYVEISSEVEGPVSPSLVDEVAMKEGGSALHFLDSPPDGSYVIRGSVQIGYPLPWGFDGYYSIECPSWFGDIVNAGEGSISGDGAALVGITSNGVSVSEPSVSSVCDSTGSCQEESSFVVGPVDPRGVFPRLVNTDTYRPQQNLGTIEAIDNDSLVLRTRVGRHASFILPPQLIVNQQSKITETEINSGDTVGVAWGSAAASDTGEIKIRVYRNTSLPNGDLPEIAVPQNNPRIEFRSVLDSVVRSGDDSLRLVYSQGNTTLVVPADVSITLIEPLIQRELDTLTGKRVRVVSQIESDGTRVVRALEILQ